MPPEYPFKAPKVRTIAKLIGGGAVCNRFTDNRRLFAVQVKFLTKIYHPNVKSDGQLCNEVLNDGWSPQLKIPEVLMTIRQVLVEPNPGNHSLPSSRSMSVVVVNVRTLTPVLESADNPLEPEIAQQFKENRTAFNKTAKEWTKKYAK
jgi:ubiquitin-conjugating enzyme E2 D/E